MRTAATMARANTLSKTATREQIALARPTRGSRVLKSVIRRNRGRALGAGGHTCVPCVPTTEPNERRYHWRTNHALYY